MLGVKVREQEANGQGLNSFALQGVQGLVQRIFVQGDHDAAVGPDPLRHLGPQVTGHQRLHRGHAQVVAVLFQALAHLQQVSEPVGGDQPNLGPLALHQCVGGHGAAVDHHVGGRQKIFQRQIVSGGRVVEAGHQPFRGVVGRRGSLEITGRPAFLGDHKVGERATNVDADNVHGQLLSKTSFGLKTVILRRSRRVGKESRSD